MCPQNTPYLTIDNKCVNCVAPTFWSAEKRACITCQPSFVFDSNTNQCACPANTYLTNSNTCITCSLPNFWNNGTKACESCPAYNHYNPNSGKCECCPEGFTFDLTALKCLCGAATPYMTANLKCVSCTA